MSKLGFYTEDWRAAQAVTSEYITPKDGVYRVIIESVKYAEVDSEGRETDPTFIYVFCILEGECRGQKFRRFTTIRNERSAGYFKGDMIKLGLPIPANPEDLPNVFQNAQGIVVDVTVKTKTVNGKDYKDVYFDKAIGRQAPPQPAPQQPRQFTDARAQAPQGYYQQQQAYRPPQPQPQRQQPQAYAPQSSPDDIPFDPNDYTGIRNEQIPF